MNLVTSAERTAAFKRDLPAKAGGALTVDAAAALLGMTREGVLTQVVTGSMLAVDDDGTTLLPAFQIQDGNVLAGLSQILVAAPTTTSWAMFQFLVDGDEGLGPDRPMDLLRGDADAVERVKRFAWTLED